MNTVTYTPTDNVLDEYFTLTNQLRWFSKLKYINDANGCYEKTLQQLWQGSKGTQEWVDVPTENL